MCRSRWPCGLRSRSAAARLLGLWVWIPPGAWMSVCCECFLLFGRGPCVGLITRPEDSYRLWPNWALSWSLDNEEALAQGCTVSHTSDSVTYTLLCGVCFSDGNRQQRTGSCSIMYRSPWNCTSRQATTRYISTTWLIVASSASCQRHGTGTPGMILVCTALDLLYCFKDRHFMVQAILLVWV